MTLLIKWMTASLLIFSTALAQANKSGQMFNIVETGSPATVDIVLCLNGKGAVSCQNYRVSAISLSINTTIDYFYPAIGIKVVTPGYQLEGCIPAPNGYCLFAASNSLAATIQLKPISTGYTVTASGDGHESFVPSSPRAVNPGETQIFTVTADTGYSLSTIVTGTCPQGSWTGNSYTTGPIVNNCSVLFSATAQTFTVTPSAGANGSITPNTPQTVEYGSSQNFTATPNAGYSLSGWTLDGSAYPTCGTNTSCNLTNVTANHTIAVSFSQQTFTVTPSAGANGSITPNAPQTVNYGSSQNFTATPNAGYNISGWTLDGSAYPTCGTNTSCNLTNVTANHTIAVSFSQQTFTVTPSAGANGSITPNTPQTVNYGSSQNFTATPNAGYNISEWTLDGSAYPTCGTNTSCNLTNVTANHTLAVSFSQQTFTVTPSAGTNGSITPNTPQTVNYGSSQNFTAAPDTGYNISGWTLDGSAYPTCGTNTSCNLANVTANHTIAVSFSQQTFTVTPSAGAHGSITPNTPQTVNYGSSQNFTATPNIGYNISGWTLDGTAYPTCGTNTSCNLVNVTANHTIAVSFSQQTFTITPSAGANGTISPDTPQTVNYGGNQSFTAAPDTGYNVSGWTLDGSAFAPCGTNTSCTLIIVTSDHTLAVSFSQQTFTVTPSAGANGSISPDTPQTVNYGGSQNFTATPIAGYSVSEWTLDGSAYTTCGASTSCNLTNITDNHTIEANFFAVFPAATGPSNVSAFPGPGSGQVTISWTAPTNIGTGTISGYVVTYGPTSGTTFATSGCTTASGVTDCTIGGLTNGTPYTFIVRTQATLNGASETGPPSYSGSVIPVNGLAVTPSTLALSSLGGGGQAREITVINTSSSTIQLDPLGSFAPSLPTGTSVTNNGCTAPILANGGSCRITITPGTLASSNGSVACTTGIVPVPSALSLTDGSFSTTANVVVLGYGCQYQGGYVFAIDDTTPVTSSIGGKVVSVVDQAVQSSTTWSPGGATNRIWGIDETSTTTAPSPSVPPLQLGQLNCNGGVDGACNSNNMITFPGYGNTTTYAAGICAQPLTGSSNTACIGGATCYTNWYLPSVCEMSIFSTIGPPNCPPNTPNISTNLSILTGSCALGNCLIGNYWGSTEASTDTLGSAWAVAFNGAGFDVPDTNPKSSVYGIRCARTLTI